MSSQPYLTATHSTSTNAPLGNAFTATAERAGKGSLKKVEYTSFIAAKSAISAKKTVVLTTCDKSMPASAMIWAAFVNT